VSHIHTICRDEPLHKSEEESQNLHPATNECDSAIESKSDIDGSDDENTKVTSVKPGQQSNPGNRNLTQLTRVRDSILNILIERTYDKNYFTRAAVLKVWCFLIESNSIPLRFFNNICDIGIDRLKDKTSIVRKYAINLLINVLDNNPFGGNLSIDY